MPGLEKRLVMGVHTEHDIRSNEALWPISHENEITSHTEILLINSYIVLIGKIQREQ